VLLSALSSIAVRTDVELDRSGCSSVPCWVPVVPSPFCV
jgi:hypothetical protein